MKQRNKEKIKKIAEEKSR